MAADARQALADDREEPTDVCRVERRMRSPCAPCRCSGCFTVALDGHAEARLCLWCRGAGFRIIEIVTGPHVAESGGSR